MIYFHTEAIPFRLKKSAELKTWIQRIIKARKKTPGNINFIFCSDRYLLELNKKYLKHDYFTDIITFNQSDDERVISGDIYISVERVRENAATARHPADDELHRVMIHGILHLLGYNDKSASEKKKMRQKEDEYLKLLIAAKAPR